MILRPEQLRHEPMDHVVVRGRVFAHQIHGGPIFLARLAVQVEPRQTAERFVFLRQPARAIALYVEQTDAPVPRLPLWLSSATYSPASQAQLGVGLRQASTWPNSTKWLPEPEVPSCFQALSLFSRVMRVTHQSRSMTGWSWRVW